MIKIVCIGFIVVFLVFPFVRCFVTNMHYTVFYSFRDAIDYFVSQKWLLFNHYGVDMFVGMFGHGKTLSMTHKARLLYHQYGNSILFVSNYKLTGIPYVPLVNFNQLLELGEEKPPYYSLEEIDKGVVPNWYYDKKGEILPEYIEEIEEPCIDAETGEDSVHIVAKVKRWQYQGTVVLIDEIEDVLSHRNYANFPLQLLNVLTQQRKKHVYIMCSAQRFFMVDKIFRSITTNVIDCNKYWRFQNMRYYDAWDYENAMNSQLLKASANLWWFVRNKDFSSYDTGQMVSRTMSEDFISNDTHLARLGLDNVVNEAAIKKPKRKSTRRKSKK